MLAIQIIAWTLFGMMSLSKWLTGKFHPAFMFLLAVVSTVLIFAVIGIEIITSWLSAFLIKSKVSNKLMAYTKLYMLKLKNCKE